MIRGLLLFGLSALLSEAAFAQSGQWNLKDKAACSAVIIGPAGGTMSGVYRISNDGDTAVNLYLNKCAEQTCSEKEKKDEKCCPVRDQVAGKCCPLGKDKAGKPCADETLAKCPYRSPGAKPQKNVLVLLPDNTIDLFVNSCLKIEEIDDGASRAGSKGSYENLSHVSSP
jgi:hypothetical protein